MDNKIQHLIMIQGIINRMAMNSFALKGWTITLLTGLSVFAKDFGIWKYSSICILLTIMFWYLDSYYLSKEKIFRDVYDRTRILLENDVDFSMKPTEEELTASKNQVVTVMCSKTEWRFYIVLIVMSIIIKMDMSILCNLITKLGACY